MLIEAHFRSPSDHDQRIGKGFGEEWEVYLGCSGPEQMTVGSESWQTDSAKFGQSIEYPHTISHQGLTGATPTMTYVLPTHSHSGLVSSKHAKEYYSCKLSFEVSPKLDC